MVKVSIILAVYNVEKYLKQCLDSIVNQTLRDIEIICVNDGSTDSSLRILEEYAQNDNRIKIISQENQGQGIARNKGIELAVGEYLAFVDPDDWIETDAMEILYNYIKEHNSQVVRFDYQVFNDYSKKYSKHSSKLKIINFDLEKFKYFTWKDIKICLSLGVWNKFYLTQFIKDNHIIFAPTRQGEDNLFTWSVLFKADKICYIDKVLYTYRCRAGSAINSISDVTFEVFNSIELVKQFLIQNNLFEEFKDKFKEYMLDELAYSYKCIPDNSREKFKNRCLEFISEKEFKKVSKSNYKIIERIFSIKNEKVNAIKYKVIMIFGIKIKLKPCVKK